MAIRANCLQELGNQRRPVKLKKKQSEKRKLQKTFAKEKAAVINVFEENGNVSSSKKKRKNKKPFLKDGNSNKIGSREAFNLQKKSKANNKSFGSVENKRFQNSNAKGKIQTDASKKPQKAKQKINNHNYNTTHIKASNATKLQNNSDTAQNAAEFENKILPKKRKKANEYVAPNKKIKLEEKLKTILQNEQSQAATVKSKKSKLMSLREKMMEKLKAAKFRLLNEQIYTTTGHEMQRYFTTNIDDFQAYHEGYKQQVSKWPLNPLSVIIKKINKLPSTHVIADFGCGEAELANSVKQKVHSFDLVAANDSVTACDMAHVPLANGTVDVAVFCLSLMGTNLQDYIVEANRILKIGGLLKIAEVESRFESVENFVKGVEKLGFAKIWKDLSHNLFYFLYFKKVADVKKQKTVPEIKLQPCLYKKR